MGDVARAMCVVAAVEPKLAPRRAKREDASVRQALHARRPVGLGNTGLEGVLRKLEVVQRAEGRDPNAGILELVAAIKSWGRQSQQPVRVLVDEQSVFLRPRPALAA